MKLSVDFAAIERVASLYRSDKLFTLETSSDDGWEDIDVRLKRGIDVDLSEVEVIDGLLSYEGRQIILYIRDHGQNVLAALERPETGRKYHIADCHTLDEMRRKNRFERYVATHRADGLFEISGVDQFTRLAAGGETRLQVCMNCLQKINYQSFLLQGSAARRASRQKFDLLEFFESYSTRFKELPSGFADSQAASTYTADWADISTCLKQESGFTCEACQITLSEYRSLLHVHHKNGVKVDNRRENLAVLCKDCHRKQPLHGHIFLTAPEMQIIYRLRRVRGVVEKSWDSALRHVDLAVRPALELAKHRGWEPPEIGVSSEERDVDLLDAAWRDRKVAVSSAQGRRPAKGFWSIMSPGALIDGLADKVR